MFRRNERPQPDAIEVIIGPRATYSGALRSDSSIRIDGVVESGLLETLANVILTEGARVNCEIRARNVSIRGYLTASSARTASSCWQAVMCAARCM